MKRKEALSILIAAAMAVSAAGCGGGSSANTSAVEMRVQRQVGTVSLSNEKGENVTLLEKMRLSAGHNLDTAKESLVTVSMDETRLMTLGENGEASVKQDGNTLKLEVNKGTALVGLTEELKDDQAVEVRTGNMICGIRGTFVEHANNNKFEIKVLETVKSVGAEVKLLSDNGIEIAKENVGAGEKVTFVKPSTPLVEEQLPSVAGVNISVGGTEGHLEKTKCNLEEFSATTLNAIPQQEGLLKSVSEIYGLQESDTKELVSLFSQTGTSGGDSGESLPLFGEQAQAMENAAKATKETTGNETKAEIAVLKSTREVMDKAVEKVLDPEELVKITQIANEEMNEVAKAIIDDGERAGSLFEKVKDTSDHLASMAVMGIEVGLKGDDVNRITKASAEGLILSVENKSFEDRSNAIDAEIKRQHEQKNAISQWSQNFFARNTGSDVRNLDAFLDGLRNVSTAQPADNPVIVIPTPAPTPEPAPEPEPEPVAVVDDDDDDDDNYYYDTTPSSSSNSSSQSSSSTQVAGTTGRVEQNPDGSYIAIFNGMELTYNPPASGASGGSIVLMSPATIAMPVNLTLPDGSVDKLEGINQIVFDGVNASGSVITGVVTSAKDIVDKVVRADASILTVSNAMAKVSKNADGINVDISTGTMVHLTELMLFINNENSARTVTFGGNKIVYNRSAKQMIVNTVSLGGGLGVTKAEMVDDKGYLKVSDPSNPGSDSYAIYPDARVEILH